MPFSSIRGGAARAGSKFLLPLAVAALGALAVARFSGAMRLYDHNESLYVTAGWLVAHGRSVYVDFSFWQMPYSAWCYAAVFDALSPDRFLLTAKVVNWLWWLGATGAVGALGWWRWRSAGAAAAVMVAFALNPTVARCAAEASNYMPPIACALIGLAFAAAAGRQPAQARWWWFCCGAALGAAVGFKLYYLPCVAAAGLMLAWREPGETWRARCTKVVVPFSLGVVVALTPVLVVAAAHPEAFWFNNLQVHALTSEWWRETALAWRAAGREFAIPLTASEKLGFAAGVLARPENAAVVVGAVVLAVAAARSRENEEGNVARSRWLAGAVLAAAVLAVFAPTPMWPQYWGLPVPFLYVWLIMFWPAAWSQRAGRILLLGACLSSAVGDGWNVARDLRLAHRQNFWSAVSLSREARSLAAGAKWDGGPLATLQQIWAVESGHFAPMPELAYAPFTYVIASRLPLSRRDQFHLAGPEELPRLLEQRPPAAILSGLYTEAFWSDDDLTAWARQHGLTAQPLEPVGLFFATPASSATVLQRPLPR